jgi:hypothetical protein
MYNVLLWRVLLSTVAMEAQNCIPLVLLNYLRRFQQFQKHWKRDNGNTVTRFLLLRYI